MWTSKQINKVYLCTIPANIVATVTSDSVQLRWDPALDIEGVTGDNVTYKEITYQAKWWMEGKSPGAS